MKKKILVLIIFLSILFPFKATAQSETQTVLPISLSITPSVLDLNVEENGTVNQKMTIKNNYNKALPIQIEKTAYEVDAVGMPNYTLDSLFNSKDWITISPTDLILEAGAEKQIDLSITVPENTEPGSYFSTILFKPVIPDDYFDAASAHIIPYIGAVVSINVGGEKSLPIDRAIKVTSFGTKTQDATPEFTSKIENQDIFHHKIKGEIKIADIFNNELSSEEIGGITILPKKDRILTKEITKNLFPGFYNASLIVSDNQTKLTQNITFIVLPSIPQALVFTIAVLIISVLFIKRKNLTSAFTILISTEK